MVKKITKQKKIMKRKPTFKYKIVDREAGNLIDKFETKAEAEKELKKFEKQDKREGIFEPDFYAIEKI